MAQLNSFIRVAPDSTGKKMGTFEVTIGADTLEIEGVTLVDSSGNELASLPVTGPLTDTELRASAVPTKETRSATATTSQVADNAASTTLLASNSNRLGASIQNDSSAVLYLKCGTTASATDYTARLIQYAYYEVPFNYTGRIDGIWASDPGDGAARITEFT